MDTHKSVVLSYYSLYMYMYITIGELLDTIQDFAEKLGWWSELEQLMTDSEKEYVHSTL